MATGLRERRKQEARRAISGAAMALFAARGFDAVTITQVAEAAGVSKMTVTNYFPRKEDLVFDRAEATIASLGEAVTSRPPGMSFLAAIRRDYAERIGAADVTLGPPSVELARLVHGSHVLASRAREIEEQREQALTDAIAAEAGDDGPLPRIVAAQLASVQRVLLAEATSRVLAGQDAAEIRAALAEAARQAFDLLEPSLGSYGRKA
ncbi:MAG TPA: TetR family transcriptional regulator [Trebonia sp.]|jgi:AcrR family transcriptional regulator|nr:TetR family transcriptional regulator [Trebonia sp.]